MRFNTFLCHKNVMTVDYTCVQDTLKDSWIFFNARSRQQTSDYSWLDIFHHGGTVAEKCFTETICFLFLLLYCQFVKTDVVKQLSLESFLNPRYNFSSKWKKRRHPKSMYFRQALETLTLASKIRNLATRNLANLK